MVGLMQAEALMAVFNSDVFSFFLKKFIKHNQDIEINDVRQIPVVMPTPEQESQLADLARGCIALKRAGFENTELTQEQIAFVRTWDHRLSEADYQIHPKP